MPPPSHLPLWKTHAFTVPICHTLSGIITLPRLATSLCPTPPDSHGLSHGLRAPSPFLLPALCSLTCALYSQHPPCFLRCPCPDLTDGSSCLLTAISKSVVVRCIRCVYRHSGPGGNSTMQREVRLRVRCSDENVQAQRGQADEEPFTWCPTLSDCGWLHAV